MSALNKQHPFRSNQGDSDSPLANDLVVTAEHFRLLSVLSVALAEAAPSTGDHV